VLDCYYDVKNNPLLNDEKERLVRSVRACMEGTLRNFAAIIEMSLILCGY
jgi:hypothetical protein